MSLTIPNIGTTVCLETFTFRGLLLEVRKTSVSVSVEGSRQVKNSNLKKISSIHDLCFEITLLTWKLFLQGSCPSQVKIVFVRSHKSASEAQKKSE